jgi:TonB family protein
MSGDIKVVNSVYFNISTVFLTILFHITVIFLLFQFKPAHKAVAQKSPYFDLVEMQYGKTDIIQQSLPKEHFPQKTPSETMVNKQAQNATIKEIVSPNPIPADSVHKNDSMQKDNSSKSLITEASNPGASTTNQPFIIQSTDKLQMSPGSEQGTVDAGELGIKPEKIYGDAPPYPRIAQDLGISGIVRVLLTIDTTGSVKEVKILSSPHQSMSNEVNRTLLKWKFKPVEYKGKRVMVKKCIQEVEYKVDD